MKAVVLAAGRGVRLRPLTDKKPKALVELQGKPLIEHVLESLKEAGIKEIAIVVGYLGEMVKERLGNEFNGMKLSYFKQEGQQGTANAIALAEEFVGQRSFVCTYTDVIAGSDIFRELIEKFGEKKGTVFAKAVEKVERPFDAVVVGREVKDPWRFGVLKVEGDKVTGIVEKPAVGEEPGNIINAGIYWFSTKIFGVINSTEKSIRGEYEITDSLQEIAKQERLGFIKYDGGCVDISSKVELEEAGGEK